jgi:glycosyltransferase involved in cell wall biosynthesis
MNNPLVSICVPTYNSINYLKYTLDTILSQTYQNFEIILGDNASNDGTSDIIKDYSKKDSRIKFYINQHNLGYAKNCNKLISLSKGEYVAIYHSDDLYDPQIVEKQVNFLTENADCAGVFTSFYFANEYGNVIDRNDYMIKTNLPIIKVFLHDYVKILLARGGSCFFCPSSMIKKDVYISHSGYNESLTLIEDQDMWARILLNGNYLGIINEKLVKYRIHSSQGSSAYLLRRIGEPSKPLVHIKNFIIENNLIEIYNQDILKSESRQLLSFLSLAVRENEYHLFLENLYSSKQKFIFPFYTKYGLVQSFPLTRITYLIIKFLT